MSSSADQYVDVAIVGGGVAGVYCSWRLLCDAPAAAPQKPVVALFEGSQRIGGRLASFTAPQMPHVVGELGGMQFLASDPLVSALVQHRLGLPVTPSPLNTSMDREMPHNISYLRGRHLRNDQLVDPALLPYQLTWGEQGQDPTSLLRKSLESLFPGVTYLTGAALTEYLQKAHFKSPEGKDLPLYEWGFWNLLSYVLSQEACKFIRDSLGYEALLSNYNAAAMIQECQSFFPKEMYYAITAGYDQLPHEMADQFKDAGGLVHTGWRLLSFEKAALPDTSTGVRLVFCTDNTGWGPTLCSSAATVTVYARSLILAMPRQALESIAPIGPAAQISASDPYANLRALLAKVTPLPIFKLFLCYPYSWWEKVSPAGGMAISDLPVQQCTYWGVENQQPNGEPTNTCSLTMASLADSQNVSFWEGLRSAPPPGPSDPSQDNGSANWRAYAIACDSPLVVEAHRQLLAMHGMEYAPAPYAAAAIDWTIKPYGGGVHYWQHHVDYWNVAQTVVHPEQDLPLFICGEAYSCNQGTVEGALETAEAVLEHAAFPYRLGPPEWVAATKTRTVES